MCTFCGLLRRKDNLKNKHFPSMHPEITDETLMYLKVGECPVKGRGHVTKFLDMIDSSSKYPALPPSDEENDEDYGDESEDSQAKYDQPDTPSS